MSVREVGSYIGHNRVTTTAQNSASGIWSLAAVERRRRADAWPGQFLPSNIAGLQLWLDASDASTLYDATSGGSLVAADGGVARWEDKSGNARHATQGTSANRPARKTAIQGGMDVLRFDGSNDSLSIASSTAAFKFLHSADSTVFVISKPGTTANPLEYYVLLSTSSAGSGGQAAYSIWYEDRELQGYTANDNCVVLVGRGSGASSTAIDVAGTTAPVGLGGWTANTFSLVTNLARPTNATTANRLEQRKNGGAAVKGNIGTAAAGTGNAPNDLRISGFAGGTDLWNGDIAEVIMYDSALSDADREAVENYLIAKWAIS